MTATIRWAGTVTAVSSIAHGGQQLGTTTLLRREKMLLADGRIDYVPVISGNTFRGWLRRVGEDLLREQLRYDGQLSLTAAHALRGGGALAKTSGRALAGQRLATLRSLVPQIGVFGCAAGGSVVNGCLQVGKVVPLVTEVAHTVCPCTCGTVAPIHTSTCCRWRPSPGRTTPTPMPSPADTKHPTALLRTIRCLSTTVAGRCSTASRPCPPAPSSTPERS